MKKTIYILMLLSVLQLACNPEYINRGRVQGYYSCNVYREAHYVVGPDSSWTETSEYKDQVYFYKIDTAHNKTDMVFESGTGRYIVHMETDYSFYDLSQPDLFYGRFFKPDSIYATEKIGSLYLLEYKGRK